MSSIPTTSSLRKRLSSQHHPNYKSTSSTSADNAMATDLSYQNGEIAAIEIHSEQVKDSADVTVPNNEEHAGEMNSNDNGDDDNDNNNDNGENSDDENGDDNNSNNNNDQDAAIVDDGDAASILSSSRSDSMREYFYNWRLFFPATGNPRHWFRWLMVGGGAFAKPQSDASLNYSLAGLARCLILMRQYLEHYGLPRQGGARDQEYVLREVIRDLYAGGVPLWALEPVMQKAAEGLTGQPNVNWLLFPRKAFVYSPSTGATSMFKMERGFFIRKMDRMEKVAVRLASFASNVQGVANIPARFPNPKEFTRAARTESMRSLNRTEDAPILARKILRLASKNKGLFYYINSQEYQGSNDSDTIQEMEDLRAGSRDSHNGRDTAPPIRRPDMRPSAVKDFWVVTEEERDLFSRLACQEAMRHIKDIDKVEKEENANSNAWLIIAYRMCASAGACAFWFQGSWVDMFVAAVLAVLVAAIGTSSILSKQERLIYETIASFFVGLSSSMIALTWPNHTCFAAMAIAGILDILQGFRVVYSVIELMSKHTVAGSADLLEGILFTGLIAYFLRFGQYLGHALLKEGDFEADFTPCTNGIDEFWYILFVPAAALSWSGLFYPNRTDLPLMAFHGILGYGVNYSLTKAGVSAEVNNFIAASSISLSAGIISRFTGRQAVGNTVAGMYVLLPGAYLVKSLYQTEVDGSFLFDVISQAIIIGIGGWTGTILVSPTLLGTTKGLLGQQLGYNQQRIHDGDDPSGRGHHKRDDSRLPANYDTAATMLFF